MKVVHISDTHIHHSPIMDADPVANFRECIGHVREFHSDADLVLITGDLTHHGLEDSYRTLKILIEDGGLTGRLRPRMLIGNHDNREVFARVFPEIQRDEHGFIQSVEQTPAGLFVYLDTHQPGTHAGHFCEKRQTWLRATLAAAASDGIEVWLCMHPNPMRVHVANADLIGLVDAAAFHDIVAEYRNSIRHIFFGHCHFALSGSVHGVPVSAPRSTNHPNWPEFSGNPLRIGYANIDRNYNLCLIDGATTVIHSMDFQAERQAIWLGTQEDGWIKEG